MIQADKKIVFRKTSRAIQDLRRIAAKIQGVTEEKFLQDEDLQDIVERRLQKVIGAMVDVNFHVVAAADGSTPTDYHESFLRMAALGVIEKDAAERLALSAGLRNRITHDYDGPEYDLRVVYQSAKTAIAEVPPFFAQVAAAIGAADISQWLEKNGPGGKGGRRLG